jgi:glycosyltransferase involved in cell wall biosynthesis
MRILLVGPGIMEIPSKGWGAVETVVWQLKISLEKRGHTVDILNKRGLKAALAAKPRSYDLVHLQYDDLAGFWIILSKIMRFKLAITSHYGYLNHPSRWHRSYWPVFLEMWFSPRIIVLSEEIKKTFLRFHYRGFIAVLPNGTEISAISFSDSPSKDLICLGKVEPRKRQTGLSRLFSTQSELQLDFVGPIVDKNFAVNHQSTRYLGTWTREDVEQKLTQYKVLVLLSDGEAHALVIGEALAAGLSLLISQESAANLDLSLPFIQVASLDDPLLVEKAQVLCAENGKYRQSIRKYAEQFDWDRIAEKYERIVSAILKK